MGGSLSLLPAAAGSRDGDGDGDGDGEDAEQLVGGPADDDADGERARSPAAAAAYDDDPEQKSRGTVRRRAALKCAQAACGNGRWRRWCCALSVLANIAFVSATIGLAVRAPQVVAVARAVSSEADWNAHFACVADPVCDLAAQPLVLMDQPPGAARLAILSQRGSGGTLVRLWLEWASRLRTAIDDCFAGHQFGDLLNFFTPTFTGECAGSFFFAHAWTRFFSVDNTRRHRGYAPTHLVLVDRNPFEVARSAFEFERTCGGVHTLACLGRAADPADFCAEHGWPEFALSAAREWVAQRNFYDAFDGPKTTVAFEDLTRHGAREPAVQALLAFAKGAAPAGAVPEPARAIAAAVRLDAAHGHDTKRARPVDTRRVFTDQLRADFCAVVRARWRAERWGPTCGQ